MFSAPLNKNNGFTLIELMVVITIIGLLASTLLAAMTSARERARDASRVASVKELQKALELYRNANGGNYPCTTATCPGVGSGGTAYVNGTSNSAYFNSVMVMFLALPLETVSFTTSPATLSSIGYRPGGALNTPVRDSYTIFLRREQAVTKSDGSTINAQAWCRVQHGPTPASNPTEPSCF